MEDTKSRRRGYACWSIPQAGEPLCGAISRVLQTRECSHSRILGDRGGNLHAGLAAQIGIVARQLSRQPQTGFKAAKSVSKVMP